MPITALPTPPLRSDPANFSARADALLGALPQFVTEANSLEQSLQLVATTGTSTTSIAIGTGSKAFATQTGKAWAVGSFVYVVSSASVANMMTGQVTAYNSGTGALTVNVLVVTGSGTLASWVIGLAVPPTAAVNIIGGTAGQLHYQSAANTTAFLGTGTLGQILRSGGAAAPTWVNPEAAMSNVVAGGTADALTATFVPAVTALTAGIIVYVRAASANATIAPTFQANATAAKAIVKGNGVSLQPGDIAGAGHWLELAYDATLDKWVLANPATGVAAPSMQGARRNLALSATGASAVVTITADGLVMGNGSGQYITDRVVSTSASTATTGAGGLDTGTIAINTWYAVWVICNGVTTSALLSLSSTAPTMPAGYTFKARVGWIRTDASANKYPLGFIQHGSKVSYRVAAATNVTAYPALASGSSSGVTTAIALGAFVPSTASHINAVIASNAVSAPATFFVVGPSAASTTNNSLVLSYAGMFPGNTQYAHGAPVCIQLESMNIYYNSNTTAIELKAAGWEDNL